MQRFGLKANARKVMVENAPKLFFVGLVYVTITTVLSELGFRLPGTSNAYDMFLQRLLAGEVPTLELFYSNLRYPGLALSAVILFLSPVIEAGFMHYCLKASRAQECGFKDLFNGFMFFGKIILISIIASFFIFMWSLLFIIPGIAAIYRYRQAYYILLDDPDKGVLQCIRESKRMMAGKKLDLFFLDLSFIGWVLVDNIIILLLPVPFALPIISIWLAPYLGLSRALYYNQLVENLVV